MITSLFYILSFIALIGALMVVASKNPVYSVLYLIVTFFAIAGHYVLLNAQFLAAVHVIVYAGAIMVLFLFVIMLLNLNADTEPHKSLWLKFAAAISGGLMLVVLIGMLKGAGSEAVSGAASNIGLIQNLGKVLYKDFMLPFEVSAILFLAAMVGTVMLGKKEV